MSDDLETFRRHMNTLYPHMDSIHREFEKRISSGDPSTPPASDVMTPSSQPADPALATATDAMRDAAVRHALAEGCDYDTALRYVRARTPAAGAHLPTSTRQQQEAVRYAREKGCTYDEAVAAVKHRDYPAVLGGGRK